MESDGAEDPEGPTLEGWISSLRTTIEAAYNGTREVDSIPEIAGSFQIACPGCRITKNLANQMERFFESVDSLQQTEGEPQPTPFEGGAEGGVEDGYATKSRRARAQLMLRLTVEALHGLRSEHQPAETEYCKQHNDLGLTEQQWEERNSDPEGCSLSETQLAQCRELGVVTQRWMGPSEFSTAFHKDIERVYPHAQPLISKLSQALEMDLKEPQTDGPLSTPTSALSPQANNGLKRFGSQAGMCNKCGYYGCICEIKHRRKRHRDAVESDDSAEQLVKRKKRKRAQIRRGHSISNSGGMASPLTPGSSRAKSQTFSFSQSRSPGSRLEQSSMDQSSSATRTAAPTNRNPPVALSRAPTATPSKAAKKLFGKSLLRDANAGGMPKSPFTPMTPRSSTKKPPPRLLGEMMCESPGVRRRHGFAETSSKLTLTYCGPPRSGSALTKEALSQLPGKEALRTTPAKGVPVTSGRENTRLRQRCRATDLSLKLPQPSGDRAPPTLLEGNPFASQQGAQCQPELDLELSTPLRRARRRSTRKTFGDLPLSQPNVQERVAGGFNSLGSQAACSPPTQAQEVARALSFDTGGEDFIPGSDSE